MDKATLTVSFLPFLKCIQIPHTQRNINSKKSTPRPGFTATTKQPVGWQETWKGGGKRGNKTQEGTYRHAFPSKGCRETEKMERGVSNAARDRAEDTGRQRGAPEQREFPNLKPSESLLQDSTSPSGAPKAERQTELPRLVLAGVGRLMRSGHQAEWLEEHGTLPNLPGIWPRRGKRTPDNTDNAKRGWVRQRDPTGSW